MGWNLSNLDMSSGSADPSSSLNELVPITRSGDVPVVTCMVDGSKVLASWTAKGGELGWTLECEIGNWKLPLRSKLDRWHAPRLEMNFPECEGMGIRIRVAQCDSKGSEMIWSDWQPLVS